MLTNVLSHVRSLMKVEAAALLLCTDAGGQVFSVQRPANELEVRTLDATAAQSLVAHTRFAIARRADAGGGLPDVLLPPGAAGHVGETLSAPLSDGRTQIGVLQLIDRVPAAVGGGDTEEESTLRLLSLVAAQLARGISMRREREAGERAERLSLLGHSVGAILHDMRTPLTAVAGYVELMTDEPSADTRREHAARIGRALEHMEAMTQEVLSFARGQREVLVAKVYLHKFIEEVREMLVPETARFGVALQVDAKYDGTARFDESKLKRVIFNLARNACQAMANSTSVRTFRWSIERVGDQLVFECSDSGPGIPKEMEGRLFESFASHGKTGGTGLGLAMAKKIVDAHCGRITVISSPGKGATFRIEIPL
jgi:signal transduction histidine kinase